MGNGLGVNGPRRTAMARGGQKCPEIVQRTKMRWCAFEDVKIGLSRVERVAQSVKQGRPFDPCFDRVGIMGHKIIELPQPRPLKKPRGPGCAAHHAIFQVWLEMDRPTRARQLSTQPSCSSACASSARA
jgi:hypothetical protein